MAWWIEPLEIADDQGNPTGRWRLTETSDEDGGGPFQLCWCKMGHESPKAARECPEASKRVARKYGL